MSGARTHDVRGQLALLDAMVFFTASALICGMMMSYVESGFAQVEDGDLGALDTAEVLRVYLVSSVGRTFEVSGASVVVMASQQMGEVLLLVACAVVSGCPVAVFGDLLEHSGEVLCGLCAYPWSPHLLLWTWESGRQVTVLELGAATPDTGFAAAASQALAGVGGTEIVATLVLSPALPPHGIGV